MIKKTVKYTDFNGDEQTTDVYFHLSKSEIADMELTTEGGWGAKLEAIATSDDPKQILGQVRSILEMSYGVKSDDGQRFSKTPELWQNFTETPAFDALYFELVTDGDAAAQFMNGLMPADLLAMAQKRAEEKGGPRMPQDHRPKQNGVRNPVPTFGKPSLQDTVEIGDTEAPLLDAGPTESMTASEPVEEQKVWTHDEILSMSTDKLLSLNAQGLTGNHQDGYTIPRPPHESGPGFQTA